MSRIGEADFNLRQLTLFPEFMELVDYGRVLQIRNILGCMRLPINGGLPQSIPGLSSFADGVPALGGRVESMASSGDGKWILYVEAVSPAFGNLILLNALGGTKTLIARNIERSGARFPACWSPDSRVFVYSRGGRLYYQTINAANPVPVSTVDEQYRYIGTGGINAVRWGAEGDFFYLQGSTVYRVWGSELFARAMYRDFLELGASAGKLPFPFEEHFDSFWIAPDSRSILLLKGGRNVFFFPLDADEAADNTRSLPYIKLPQFYGKLQVLWPSQGLITLLASLPRPASGGEGPEVIAYRFDAGGGLMPVSGKEAGKEAVFQSLDPPAGAEAALSPDGTKAVIWGSKGAVLYDYPAWKPLETIRELPAYSCLWRGNHEFILGTNTWIERITLKSQDAGRDAGGSSLRGAALGSFRGRMQGFSWSAAQNPAEKPDTVETRRLLCLASAGEAGFEERTGTILMKIGNAWFGTDGSKPWSAAAEEPVLSPASLTTERYRVYLEWQNAGPYRNIPMIRHIVFSVTTPLLPVLRFPDPVPLAGDRPAREGGGMPAARSLFSGKELFTHGKRAGAREIALCFDLYDDAAGLLEVLETLRVFDLRATFFLNGEFIRRHPAAARGIAAAGHETASLFFSPMDISDTRYQVQGDFILQGLARNEDEFFKAAGKELTLLWHPPYYAVSSDIVAAAAQAGYITIGRDVDPLDWITQEEARRIGIRQYAAPEMIDRIMEQILPGSIVPIRLGALPGGRPDYLFGSLGVLLDALIRSDFTLAPVSVLLEHNR
jgi:hypothetical protein